MAFCVQCGAKLTEKGSFCPVCGTPLAREETEAVFPAAGMELSGAPPAMPGPSCPRCGAMVDQNLVYCTSCAHEWKTPYSNDGDVWDQTAENIVVAQTPPVQAAPAPPAAAWGPAPAGTWGPAPVGTWGQAPEPARAVAFPGVRQNEVPDFFGSFTVTMIYGPTSMPGKLTVTKTEVTFVPSIKLLNIGATIPVSSIQYVFDCSILGMTNTGLEIRTRQGKSYKFGFGYMQIPDRDKAIEYLQRLIQQ
ncbi:MAG: zinc ribbon domain-containing protein [Bacillota bacterium]|nr:zinc ribbon domain-containing protein [Bacillota bacterium]